MELKLLNDKLRRGQSAAQSANSLLEEEVRVVSAELRKAKERLEAMPRRFSESLQLLRDEAEALEREKMDLQVERNESDAQARGYHSWLRKSRICHDDTLHPISIFSRSINTCSATP